MKLPAYYFELDVWTARASETARRLTSKLGTRVMPGVVCFLLVPQRFSSHWAVYISIESENLLWVRREPAVVYAWVSEVGRGYLGNWTLCDQVFSGIFMAIRQENVAVAATVEPGAGFAYLSLDKELVRYAKVAKVKQVQTNVEVDTQKRVKAVWSTNQIAERMGLSTL